MKKIFLILIVLFSVNSFAIKGYVYNSNTKEYVGDMDLQFDPLESKKVGSNIYLLPPGTTTTPPPSFDISKQKVIWDNKKWNIEAIPTPPPAQEPVRPTAKELLQQKEEALIRAEIRKIAIERLGDKLELIKE